MTRPVRRRVLLNPTLQISAVADVSRRGRGRAQVTVHDAAAVRFLLASVTGAMSPPRLASSVRQRLIDDGVLVGRGDVPGEVLLDPRLDVRGGRETRRTRPRTGAAVTNGRLVTAPALPPEVARQTATSEAFLPTGDVLWVRDPGSRIMLPVTLTRRAAAVARRLLDPTRPGPDPALTAPFVRAGLVVTRRDSAARRLAWARRIDDWRRQLRVRGFAVVRGLFPPLFLEALRTYYRGLDREGYLLGGEMRRAGYPLVHGEPVLRFLEGQVAPVVRAITRESVPATFPPYLRIYDPGSVLDRHRDHAVCRWNVDLVVGGDPAPTRATCSPIWIASRRRVIGVRLALGDALLYRGTKVEHWRRPHPAGRTTAMASLHYGPPPAVRRRKP